VSGVLRDLGTVGSLGLLHLEVHYSPQKMKGLIKALPKVNTWICLKHFTLSLVRA